MKFFYGSFFLITVSFLLIFSCRKVYDPPAIKGNNHFLAVDGIIYVGTNVSNSITVSRSLNLSDSIPHIAELQAQVVIESAGGKSYTLTDTAGNGTYTLTNVTLDSTQQYRLAINTSDGNKYISDFVTPKAAPPIDSLSWSLSNDSITNQQAVMIYVNAHDPTNSTRYYRWDFLQTYKHVSHYETAWGEADSLIYPLPVGYSIHSCWSTVQSNTILLGTSINLAQDVISHVPIANIAQNDPRMDIGSSFLVRQYPLTMDAYTYWLTVQKNSQSLGGLFDLQPSQITGNIHCTSNPDNPALGYISASNVSEKRIYISNKSLPGWQSNPYFVCPTQSVELNQLNLLLYTYPDTAYAPYHFGGDLIVFLVVAPKSCMDCRYQGGVIDKPDFWPEYD
jgi:Domain of unknown function (DUF4249)